MGVLYYPSAGRTRRNAAAKEVGDGVYEASLAVSKSGAYYVYVVVPSLKVGHLDLPYFTLIAEEDGKSPATKEEEGDTEKERGADAPKGKP